MADPVLTTMRRAIWTAVRSRPALTALIKRSFDFEGDTPTNDVGEPRITIGDLPSMEIAPAANQTAWKNNQSQEILHTLAATVLTRWTDVLAGERIWEEFVRAVNQADAVFSTAGCRLLNVGQATCVVDVLDGETGPFVRRWNWTITLLRRWNPRGES